MGTEGEDEGQGLRGNSFRDTFSGKTTGITMCYSILLLC